jgi:LasA protease
MRVAWWLVAGLLCLALQACQPVSTFASSPVAESHSAAPFQFPTATPAPLPSQTVEQPPAISPTGKPMASALPPRLVATESGALASPSLEPGKADWQYQAQSGDTLEAVAARFQVRQQEITSPQPLGTGFLHPGQTLRFSRQPARPADAGVNLRLLPDSEVVFSASAVDLDVAAFVQAAGGYLSVADEYLRSTSTTPEAQVLVRSALENSVNPRLLLALLDYRCNCLYAPLPARIDPHFLLDLRDPLRAGLYRQLGWAANQLSIGYYGWRAGLLTHFYFRNGASLHLPPDLNAGSAALAYLFARLTNYDEAAWRLAFDPAGGFMAHYRELFGDPWARAVEPLIPGGLQQPDLTLPFEPGKVWSYSSGPHKAWETDGALAALDFAPKSEISGCVSSKAWVVAVADGLIVRSEFGAVVQDLGSQQSGGDEPYADGLEQTGWNILYMHIATRDRVPLGAYLRAGDPIGHPSCEGGPASGTHLHIARKYNGEWMDAAGPVPFVMDGWVAQAGYKPYEGSLSRAGVTIVANPWGTSQTLIRREK